MRTPFDPAADAHDDSAYRWGMTIDLDRCTGCSACVVACSIENNIPTVGEEAMVRARQMQWIRIERYIGAGEPTLKPGRQPFRDREKLGDTDVRTLPMLCQHCGAAPCEPVCPVIATYQCLGLATGWAGSCSDPCCCTRPSFFSPTVFTTSCCHRGRPPPAPPVPAPRWW